MHRSVLARQVAPAIMLLAGLIVAAVVLDSLMHTLGFGWVGMYLGPIGSLMLIASFAYSLKKRKKIAWGQPKQLLEWHQALGWFGSLVLMVHGGEHFHALLPWLALIAMVVVAASGMVGAVLLKRALEIVRENAKGAPDSPNAVLDAATVDLMKKWRMVHMPLNAVFVVLALVHIIAVLWMKPW